MRVSSIRRRTTHDSYAYVPCGCCAAYYHSPLSLSLPFPLSSSPGFSLYLPTTSFQCTSLIFWPLANTDTIEKSVGLHATAESEWREPVSLSDFDLFAKEVCPLLLLNRVHTESLSRNVEEIDYILSVSSIIGTWRKLSEWSRKILLFEIIFH